MDCSTGEYFVSLKNYKIPLKSTDKTSKFGDDDPPPPGTENEIDTFSSPLAALNRPPQPKFQAPTPTSPPTQTSIQGTSSPPKPTKRSSLFSKLTFFNISTQNFLIRVQLTLEENYVIKM